MSCPTLRTRVRVTYSWIKLIQKCCSLCTRLRNWCRDCYYGLMYNQIKLQRSMFPTCIPLLLPQFPQSILLLHFLTRASNNSSHLPQWELRLFSYELLNKRLFDVPAVNMRVCATVCVTNAVGLIVYMLLYVYICLYTCVAYIYMECIPCIAEVFIHPLWHQRQLSWSRNLYILLFSLWKILRFESN